MDPTDPDDWRQHAACRGATAKFFPPDQQRGEHEPWSPVPAQRICATCPVAVECLTYAVDARERHGIWGGAGGDLLRGFRRIRQRSNGRHDPDDRESCDCDWCAAIHSHLERIRELVVTEITRPRRAPHRNGPAVTHGKASTYARGCRCARCKFRVSAPGIRLHDVGVDVPAWWDRKFGTRHGFSTQPKRVARECVAARNLVTVTAATSIRIGLNRLGRDVTWLADQLAEVCAPDIARQLADTADTAHLITPVELAAVAALLGVDATHVLTGQAKVAA